MKTDLSKYAHLGIRTNNLIKTEVANKISQLVFIYLPT